MTKPTVQINSYHKSDFTCFLDKNTLESVVAEFVFKLAGSALRNVNLNSPGVSFKVQFEDATEGSPAYRVGTQARVTITIDHHEIDLQEPTN